MKYPFSYRIGNKTLHTSSMSKMKALHSSLVARAVIVDRANWQNDVVNKRG